MSFFVKDYNYFNKQFSIWERAKFIPKSMMLQIYGLGKQLYNCKSKRITEEQFQELAERYNKLCELWIENRKDNL